MITKFNYQIDRFQQTSTYFFDSNILLFPNIHLLFFYFISAGVSVFDYIDRHAQRTPAFHNFMYLPDPNHTVLRPFNNLSDLQIWNYYFGEELKHGPSYDYELVIQDLEQVKYCILNVNI